jgi:hypothetical protein
MRRVFIVGLALGLITAGPLFAQTVSPNVPVLPLYNDANDLNAYLKGDLYLQRQVEPTIAVSTRNPDHLISFFNDYRAVDIPDPEGIPGTLSIALRLHPATEMLAQLIDQVMPRLMPPVAAAEAWVGMSRSYDGGQTWLGGMLPGGPFDGSPASLASPVYGRQAATDPVAGAAPCGYAYVVFVAFTRGDESSLAVARYQDLNNDESGDTWVYDRTWVLETGNNATNGYFLDKPFLAVDVDRSGTGGCGHSVYVSYTTFNGLDKDGKFQSKLNFVRSLDGGQTWDKTKVNQPYGESQGTALAVDPRQGTPKTTGGGTVYLVWRHFFSPDAMLMISSKDYGTKWTKPVVLTQGPPLAPFDQPTLATTAVPNAETDIAFRTNAFPTAAVTAGGRVFAAWQERVSLTEGSPGFGRPDPAGSPRIVVVRSDDGGATWKDVDGNTGTRKAVDFADRDLPSDPGIPAPGFGGLPQDRPSGPQVKPRLIFGGGRLLLAYTESRGLLTGEAGVEQISPVDIDPNTTFATGYNRVFDFRAALLDPATGQKMSSTQVSRYAISAAADLLDGEDAADVAPINPPCSPDFGAGLAPCVRQLNRANSPQSGAGTSPFMGDYPDATPVVSMVPLAGGAGWRWATEPGDVPSRGFHVVFPDNRHLIPPTFPEDLSEVRRYPFYEPPGSGELSCVNPGSRNTDVLTARVDADLVLSTPTSYKQLDARRSFPFALSNRTGESRFYRLTITDGAASATFSPKSGIDIDSGDLEVLPYSSVAHVVYVEPGSGPVRVEVVEILGPNADPEAGEDPGDPVPGGQSGAVVFNADPDNPEVVTLPLEESQTPFVENPFVENPFVENPFVENPFVENPFVENPFVENPFVENPFVENSTVADVIDTTWTVKAQGSNTAASYLALVNIDNAEQFVGNYAFQLIVYRNASYATPNGCETTANPAPQILSNVTQNPFVENPFVENPFVENPFVENPFVENPFVENSTFALAPSDAPQEAYASIASPSGDGTTKAPRGPDQVKILLRAYQLVPDAGIEATGGFFYNPDPDQGGDSPALTVIARGCDTSDPDATCYFSKAPDLVATAPDGAPLDATPLEVAAGVPFAFPAGGWTLHNQGTTPANAENRELRHGVYLSADETVSLGSDDQPLDGDILVGVYPSNTSSIAVGGGEPFDAASFTIPADVLPGDYFLVLFVDDYREVSESDERNNQVAVAVTVTNPPPTAQGLAFTLDEDTVLANGQPYGDTIRDDVFLSATDPNNESLTYAITAWPVHGALTLVDASTGEFSYTPNQDFNGSDSFQYLANDGTSDSNTATVTLTVVAVNDAPVIGASTFTVPQDGVLNATLEASDVDGDVLTFTAGGDGPYHGTLTLNGDGTFTYAPAPRYLGADSFAFSVSDGTATVGGTATITVFDPVPNWLFVGFDSPWSPLYEINAGSAVPLKWYYGDPATGSKVASDTPDLQISATGYAACDADGNPVGEPITTLALPEDAGSSDLRYKSGDWQLNWDTSDQQPGCYLLSIYHPTTDQLDTENSQGEPLAIVLR